MTKSKHKIADLVTKDPQYTTLFTKRLNPR